MSSIHFERSFHNLPKEEQDYVKDNMKMLMEEINIFNDGIESGESFQKHEAIKQFCHINKITYEDDAFLDFLHEVKETYGTSKVFTYQDVSLVIGPQGQLATANDYIYTLEKSVMQQESFDNLCTFLGFKDIFKLLVNKIKTTFKGEKNG